MCSDFVERLNARSRRSGSPMRTRKSQDQRQRLGEMAALDSLLRGSLGPKGQRRSADRVAESRGIRQWLVREAGYAVLGLIAPIAKRFLRGTLRLTAAPFYPFILRPLVANVRSFPVTRHRAALETRSLSAHRCSTALGAESSPLTSPLIFAQDTSYLTDRGTRIVSRELHSFRRTDRPTFLCFAPRQLTTIPRFSR